MLRRIGELLAQRATRRRTTLVLVLATLLFSLLAPFVSSVAHAQFARGAVHPPHRGDPKVGTSSTIHLPKPPKDPAFTATKTPQSINRPGPMGMQPGTLTLSPTQATSFLSSDGRLEVDAPAGVITTADLAVAHGKVLVQIAQIVAASGSNAGGSGLYSFGTFLFTFVDGQGKAYAAGPRLPLTVRLHVGTGRSALDLTNVTVIFNGAVPKDLHLGTRGAYVHQRAVYDPTAGTLTTQLAANPDFLRHPGYAASQAKGYPPPYLTFNTNARVAVFGAPSPFNVDLNAGALSQGTQIDVPAGPGGTLPNITLAYNSAAVSEQHSPQGAASWVGEGWSMGLGQISWAEHNVQQNTGGARWQDSWQLIDPFGTSDQLIPPDTNESTYYDDTPNGPDVNVLPWHTASESHIKIFSMNSGISLTNMPIQPPCFRVFLTNGIMEEFGCTTDSIQYYYVPGKGYYVNNWLLDLITSPTGNQVQIVYQQDMVTTSYGGVNYRYPRDAQMQTISWDSPNCLSANTRCTGSAWSPLYRVYFNASHSPSYLTNVPSGCNTGTNLRCDDPLDLSGSGGLAAPISQNTWVLNQIVPQLNVSGTWKNLKVYDLSYEQSGPTTRTDPVTGEQESMAGMLDLTKVQEFGTDGTTAYPATTLGYSTQTEYYTDSTFYPYSIGFCGPSWNQGGGGGSDCSLWSQSYDGNSRYLSSVSNGEGLAQTFSWTLARNNTHGLPTGNDPTNPLYCTQASLSVQSAYPCDAADDQAWSRVVVAQRDDVVVRVTQNGQGGSQTNTPVDSQHHYTYYLTYPLSAQECGDCVAGMYWGNQNDGDYLDYYNGSFMGFREAAVSNPDGSLEYHQYYATHGWGVFDTTQVTSCPSNLPPIISVCHADPWWDLTNAAHGREYEADYYDTNGTSLLKKTTTTWGATCPPSGVSASPPVGSVTWDGNRVSEVDSNNPVAVCEVLPSQSATFTYDGGTNSVTTTTTYTYDSYGRVTQQVSTPNGGTAPKVVKNTAYSWNDGVNPTQGSTGTVTGTYLIDLVAFTDTEDGGSPATRLTCAYTGYDGQPYGTGQNGNITFGLQSTNDHYTSCGTAPNYPPSNQARASQKYDSYGNPTASDDPDANAGDSTHQGCTVASTLHTSCTAYDPTTQAKPTSSANARNQANTSTYSNTADGGWGQWVISSTDANSATTSYTYDVLGRTTSTTLPGETSGEYTTATAYANWCRGTAAQAPCVEEDHLQRLDSGTLVTTRLFYDGYHRLVETRSPAPNNQDVVNYTFYDVAGRAVSQSIKYFVAAYTGGIGAAAFSIPDSSVTLSSTSYDGLGRTLSSIDAISEQTSLHYAVVCAPFHTDSGFYEQTQVLDANNHQTATLVDGLGRKGYSETFTGTGTFSTYGVTNYQYDAAGRLVKTILPNGSQATSTYDAEGHVVASSDPDLGSYLYTYDANGNQTMIADPRGGTGQVFVCYDGLNRKTKLITGSQCSTSPSLATWSYDAGQWGQGHLSGETYTSNRATGSYAYSYDARGQKVGWTATEGGTPYTFTYSYNDAGMPLVLTYPDSSTLTAGYTAQGWPQTAQQKVNGVTTTVVSSLAYSGIGGANSEPTYGQVGNGHYTWNLLYDGLARPTTEAVTSGSTTEFSQTRGYDSVGNVASVQTTLPAGTDHQAFCYDEQNRLTWAGATGTPPLWGIADSWHADLGPVHPEFHV